MHEIGIIVEENGKYAKAAVLRRSACGENCASCKGGCTPAETVLNVKNTIGAKKGDRVMLELPDKKALGAAAIVYLLPLAALFAGSAAAYALDLGEGICALSGAAAMGICFLIMYISIGRKSHCFEVEISKIIHHADGRKEL